MKHGTSSKPASSSNKCHERLAKGLVDKGVLRTEKRNFFRCLIWRRIRWCASFLLAPFFRFFFRCGRLFRGNFGRGEMAWVSAEVRPRGKMREEHARPMCVVCAAMRYTATERCCARGVRAETTGRRAR
ncbi:hypothetical protein B0H19DRAFT_655105 [Mycena capillaripes]|nr:hypothetical protein B0H19DRAFT_655105 [Mycena capillaripes]